MPCRNEAGIIEKSAASLLEQEEPPGGFEAIVVDGMSDDGTRDILRGLAETDARLRVLDNPRKMTPAGMNIGIHAARGHYIAIMGSHNRYAKNYLSRAVEILDARPDIQNVGGSMYAEGENYLQRVIAAAFHHSFAAGGARWHDPGYDGPADTVFGGVYRREVFDRIGFFDEELVRNQDDELNLRLTRAGGLIWHSPLLRSWYTPRSSLRQLFEQYRQYGYWKVRVIQKHRLPASPRHLVPGLFVLLVGITLLGLLMHWALSTVHGLRAIAQSSLWIAIAGAGVAALYALLSVMASVQTAARHGWQLLPTLPAVFATYHLAYGLGFVEGVVDFVLLRRGGRQRNTSLTR